MSGQNFAQMQQPGINPGGGALQQAMMQKFSPGVGTLKPQMPMQVPGATPSLTQPMAGFSQQPTMVPNSMPPVQGIGRSGYGQMGIGQGAPRFGFNPMMR